MGTITKRVSAKGVVTYQAKIRIKRKGAIIYQESRTFEKKKNATQWTRNRESKLDDSRELAKMLHRGVTVGRVLETYQLEFSAVRQSGRSKDADLKRLQNMPIAELDAIKLTSTQVIEHLMDRLNIDKVKPQTANNDLAWLRVAFKSVRAAKGWPLAVDELEDAVTLAQSQRLVARPAKRDRRPTLEELDRLDKHFGSRDRRAAIPMRDIMWFAVYSARRQSEITRIRWEDNDDNYQTGMVRDLKHPREKIGNDKRFKYTKAGWEIVQRQPSGSKCIFPYNAKSVSAAFTRACKILEIQDLKFHDLRHEATSRLFELGNTIQDVQQVTLHESWEHLKRYTHLRPEHVHLKE